MLLGGILLGAQTAPRQVSAAGAPERCATPRPGGSESRRAERLLAAAAGQPRAAGLVTISVWVHVLSNGPGLADGNLPNGMIEDQIEVLNDAFSGATGGEDTGFRFTLEGITRTENASWMSIPFGSKAEKAAKEALHQGDRRTLNLYTGLIKGNISGYTYYPWQKKNRPLLDGVVVRFDTLPGGTLVPYDEGDTAVHEVGHWLGLYHTFEQGCKKKGDRVADTPAEKKPSFACEGRDTCPGSAGSDPIHNFMNYSPDPCMFEFTAGQAERMQAAWATYRAGG